MRSSLNKTKLSFLDIRFINIITAIVYIISYRMVYENYLVVYQSYSYPYQINNNDSYSIWITNILAFAPVLLYRGKKISDIISIFLYVMVYVPTIIGLQYYYKNYDFVLPFQLAYFFAITIFFLASRNRLSCQTLNNAKHSINNKSFILFAVFDILLVVIVFHSRMRLVSFFDVYDLRAEFAQDNNLRIPFIGHLFMWMHSICTLLIAIGCYKKNKGILALGFLMSLVYYMSNAMKSVLFAAIAAYGLYYLIKKGWIKILFPLLITPLIIAYLLVASIGNESINMGVSILLNRTYSISAGLIPLYIDTFQKYPFTYYSHIGIVNSFTGMYPFGNRALGTAVCEISAGVTSMANTNFLVMDGYAALGLPGIFFISIVIYFLLSYINKVTNRFAFCFVVSSMMGAIMEMSNMSIFTTLLSAGLLFLIVYYRFVNTADQSYKPHKKIN